MRSEKNTVAGTMKQLWYERVTPTHSYLKLQGASVLRHSALEWARATWSRGEPPPSVAVVVLLDRFRRQIIWLPIIFCVTVELGVRHTWGWGVSCNVLARWHAIRNRGAGVGACNLEQGGTAR